MYFRKPATLPSRPSRVEPPSANALDPKAPLEPGASVRSKAKTVVPKGQGDRGDQKQS